MSRIVICDPELIQLVDANKPLLQERTATKAAAKLLRAGEKALADALAERDARNRRKLLEKFGFSSE